MTDQLPPDDQPPVTPKAPDMPLDTPEALEIRHQTHQAAALLRLQIVSAAEEAGRMLTDQLRKANLIRDDQFAKIHVSATVNGMLYDGHVLDPDTVEPTS